MQAPQQTSTRQSKRHYVTKVEDREGSGCHLGQGNAPRQFYLFIYMNPFVEMSTTVVNI